MRARRVLTRRPAFLAYRCYVRLCRADLQGDFTRPASTTRSSPRQRSSQFAVACSTGRLITDIWRTGSGQSKRFGTPLAVADGDGIGSPGRDGERQGFDARAIPRVPARPRRIDSYPAELTDPTAFTEIVTVIREKFKLAKMVMVGDRGMITSARIEALNTTGDGGGPPGGAYGWITALRGPAIRKLMAEDGPLQMSLFDQQNLAEITSPGLPRRAAGRLPQPGAGRRPRPHPRRAAGRHRKAARPLIARVAAGRLHGAGAIGVEVG
jgi:hypothetical protein